MAYFRTSDGCSLYYETVGFELARPVVIFLNGTLQTTMYWKAAAGALTPMFRSLLYDARGQGESELGSRPLSLALHQADLVALIRHLGLNAVSLVGLSHGALLAYAMAREETGLIRRLVLCSIGVHSPMRARLIVRAWQQIAALGNLEVFVRAALPHVFGEAYLASRHKMLDRIAKTIVRRNRADALAAHLKAMESYPRLRSMLGRLPMPTLVVSGSDDVLVSAAGAKEVAEKSGGRHVVMKGVGHSLPAEAPEDFLALVSRFLSGKWTDMPEGV